MSTPALHHINPQPYLTSSPNLRHIPPRIKAKPTSYQNLPYHQPRIDLDSVNTPAVLQRGLHGARVEHGIVSLAQAAAAHVLGLELQQGLPNFGSPKYPCPGSEKSPKQVLAIYCQPQSRYRLCTWSLRRDQTRQRPQ